MTTRYFRKKDEMANGAAFDSQSQRPSYSQYNPPAGTNS